MSSLQILSQQVSLLTTIVNGMINNAKQIDGLPPQTVLNPNSLLHTSLDGVSQKISVQQIISDILNFKYNRLISISGPISVSGNNVTIPSSIWVMENVNYQTFADTTILTPYAVTGYTRTDIFVGNKLNQIIRIPGPETQGISPAPNVPIDTVYFTTVNVTDSTIGMPTEPIFTDVDWGDIGGNLSDQIDLINALNAKLNLGTYNGTASDLVLGKQIVSASEKTTINDNDQVGIADSEDSNKTKFWKFLTIKTVIKTYFDAIYLGISNDQNVSGIKTFLNGKFALRNVANTFSSFFTHANTASRTWTLPDKNGTVAMTSDIPTNTVATGTQNFLSKYNNAGGTQIGNSRILDNGSFIGIETVNAPTKDITLGYNANREIGVEQSNNATAGRDLILSAGRTINYIDNALFVTLTPSFGLPSYGMCSTPSGNIYIVTGTNMLYKQTGGSGNFVSLGAVFTAGQQTRAICSTSSNDLYVAINNGDIYKQTNETGAFVALGQTARAWTGLARFGSDIYASVSGGDIYKQTGGTGNFVALGQTARSWGRMASSSTAIYVAVPGSGIYKQVGGTGNFVLHSSQANSGGIIVSNSNDIFINSGTDMYKQTNETGSFVATGSTVTNNGIWGMATHANGNIYAGDFSSTVFMLLNNGAGYSNLDGGTFKIKSGTAKGTGKSRVEIYTGQKTVSGTDMQIETLRAYYDENGYFVYLGLPTYANDAAADADSNLPSKAYYKVTGNRTVFQKP